MRIYDVGFACTTIFHYLHMRRISSYFGDRSIFIISTPKYTNNRYERLLNYFTEKHINFCDANDVISGQVIVRSIVAPYFLPFFSFIDPNIFRIRILYGYAKDAWNYAEWNKGFDLIFAYGPYSYQRLRNFSKTISIGHPRYRLERSTHEIYDVTGRSLSAWIASSNSKIILYCPTWGDLSSLNWFNTAIHELSQGFKVIIKLHHGIVLSKEYNELQLNNLEDDRLFICDETVDLFELFPVCDIVISDYSGAIFDAMLVNKKIVLVNSLPEDINDTGVLNIKKMGNVAELNDKNINKNGSLDIQIRKVLPNTDNPLCLTELVKDVLLKPVIDYSQINADLYSHQDEYASFRAFTEINNLIKEGVPNKRDISPKYIAFDKERLVRFVEKNRNKSYVIWGAGDYGQLIVSWLLFIGVRVKAIIDSDSRKQGKVLFGIPICSPYEYNFQEEILIVSFLSPSIYSLIQNVFPELANEQFIVPYHSIPNEY